MTNPTALQCVNWSKYPECGCTHTCREGGVKAVPAPPSSNERVTKALQEIRSAACGGAGSIRLNIDAAWALLEAIEKRPHETPALASKTVTPEAEALFGRLMSAIDHTNDVEAKRLLNDAASFVHAHGRVTAETRAKHESIPNGWAVVPREADDVIAAYIPHGNGPQGRDFYRRLVAVAELSGGAHLRVRHWSCNIEAQGHKRCAEWCRIPDQCPGSAELMHRPAVKSGDQHG